MIADDSIHFSAMWVTYKKAFQFHSPYQISTRCVEGIFNNWRIVGRFIVYLCVAWNIFVISLSSVNDQLAGMFLWIMFCGDFVFTNLYHSTNRWKSRISTNLWFDKLQRQVNDFCLLNNIRCEYKHNFYINTQDDGLQSGCDETDEGERQMIFFPLQSKTAMA